ncbi:MAG TPA: cation-transporting P-type ATPase, partial [Mycobacterium sp.]|nr:cation-transporting P-type ATPase [Mycobacterium sp.]
LLLDKPIIDSVLFSLAIAVGITPQLLPAVVSTSLATGSRQLAKSKVLVKRLVCIEDLGDIDILITDKTGTLTEGRIRLVDTIDPAGAHSESVRRLGLLATDVDPESGGVSANPLDAALWESPRPRQLVGGAVHRVAMLPFDHERRATSVLVDDDGKRVLVVKGAPEQVLAQCQMTAAVAHDTLATLFAAGRRVVAVAARPAAGLSGAEAAARLARHGPNAVRTHHVNALAVLGRQLRNAVLILLAGTAVVSFFLGDSMQAIIIGVILGASIGLGFVNEYRAERAAAELHGRVHHKALVRHDGQFVTVDVTDLVPGDVIRLSLGEAVPADVRLIDVNGLECNESILTGESTGSEKSPQPVPAGTELAESTDLAFMGTIVSAGEGTGVVYATGKNAEFGRIAAGLDERAPETGFQVGLRRFSYLL